MNRPNDIINIFINYLLIIDAQGFSIIIVYIVNGENAIIGPMLRRIRWKHNVDEEHTSEPIKGIVM